MRMRFFAGCTVLVLVTAIAALTLGVESPSRGDPDGSNLRHGEFIWRPELSPSGPMSMVIDLDNQRAYVRRDGVCIGITTVSTGKRGYETPTGTYSVIEKERYHRSNRYNNAPMPYMQRLTEYGMAMHGGHLPGYPASHGCIRLPLAFAALLFRETDIGMPVTITDGRPSADDAATYGNSDSSTSDSSTSDSATPDSGTSDSGTSGTRVGLRFCEPDDSQ
jgi:L,D-transpeptidase catalytic domain